jgi:hypothetical protein
LHLGEHSQMFTEPPPEPIGFSWLKIVAYVLFGACAGALGYIMRTMDAHEKVSWKRALVEFFSSGLVGYLSMLICQSMGLSPELTSVTVGICGWLGAAASIQVLQKFVWKNLGLSNRSSDDAK